MQPLLLMECIYYHHCKCWRRHTVIVQLVALSLQALTVQGGQHTAVSFRKEHKYISQHSVSCHKKVREDEKPFMAIAGH